MRSVDPQLDGVIGAVANQQLALNPGGGEGSPNTLMFHGSDPGQSQGYTNTVSPEALKALIRQIQLLRQMQGPGWRLYGTAR